MEIIIQATVAVVTGHCAHMHTPIRNTGMHRLLAVG